MKLNKYKAISIAICCLIVALRSETQGMESKPDILESSTEKSSVSMKLSAQNEVDNFNSESISSRLVNLEDSQISWASYLLSPIKATFYTANEVMNLVTHNPKLAMVVGFSYIVPAVVAAVNTTQGVVVCVGGNGPCACYTTTAQCLEYCKNSIGPGCTGNTYRSCNFYNTCPI